MNPAAPGPRLTRRLWLAQSGLGIAGLAGAGRPAHASADVRKSPGFGRARSVVVVFANGGQSQFETWDPKPDAPREVRGEFDAIRTSVPGTIVCEHLPRLAKLADRYTILRSVSHDDTDHGSATYLTLTGRLHPQKSSNPPPRPTDFPCLGAVLKKVHPRKPGDAPHKAIHINGPALVPELPSPGQDGGFLGREFEPLVIGDPTLGPEHFPSLVAPPRFDARRAWLEQVEANVSDRSLREMVGLYHQAYDVLDNPRARSAFRLEEEPAALRDRYGRHRPGQACLLARRLVEAGIPLITVMWNHTGRGQDKSNDPEEYGWDTHNDIFPVMKDHLLPRFDQSFSALIEDLDRKGLLDTTLVLCLGEFGRAPRVAIESRFAGSLAGRKHWAGCYSIVAAGAGVQRGAVIGASDRIAAYPRSERVGPWDLAATIFAALGVDPEHEYLDPLQRPFAATLGRPVDALYGRTL